MLQLVDKLATSLLRTHLVDKLLRVLHVSVCGGGGGGGREARANASSAESDEKVILN